MGLRAAGEKKLIVDYAFYEVLITKMYFISEIQLEINKTSPGLYGNVNEL